jgi:HK97 family phage prohead protease
VNRDASKILGRTKSGTLTHCEDSQGLYCEISPPDTTVGRDVVESIKRGDLDGMSFGFQFVDESWGKTADGQQLRELREVKLCDVSVVTYPAYPSTSVAMRSLFPDGIPPNVAKRIGQTPDQRAVLNPERSWMSPSMQTFYRHQDLKAKLNKREAEFEKFVLTTAPNSNLARMLRIDRVLEEIKLDQDLDENRARKAEHHARWARKDRYAVFPVWRDLGLYAKKTTDERREKDPWATRRLF